MLTVVLALVAALAYGASDFLGGRASTRAPVTTVAAVVQATSLVLVLPVAATVGPSVLDPSAGAGPALLWGLTSGLGGAVGTLFLYRGLARARVAVVAPLSGVLAAALPVLTALVAGERPSLITTVGIVAGLPAVWLIAGGGAAAAPDQVGRPRGVLEGIVAGLGFGFLFFALDRAGDEAGLWPVAAGQAGALVILGAAVLAAALAGHRPLPSRSTRAPGTAGPASGWLPVTVVSGTLAIVANTAFFLATTQGLLTVAAVLTSLYPAGTVVLARFVLDERISRSQVTGLALAGIAVVLITLG